jgi:hypothetical protein
LALPKAAAKTDVDARIIHLTFAKFVSLYPPVECPSLAI